MKALKESSPPSLIPLRYVLDGQLQSTRIPIPHDLYPDSVAPSSITWSDGVRTHTYTIRGEVVAKHIFAVNTPVRQEESAALFHNIQANVELCHQRNGTITQSPVSVFALTLRSRFREGDDTWALLQLSGRLGT
jgi:hypothetical protein